MSNYTDLINFIIKNVGGIENIDGVTHCVTRLRFNLKDESKVKEKDLLNCNEIMTAQWSNKQFQVVIGTHVSEVYKEILYKLPNLKKVSESNENDKKEWLNKLIDIITKVITPTLGVMIGCSLILGLSSLLIAFNLISVDSGTYVVLNAMGYSLYTFFPIILGYTSAKAFNSDPFIGMVVGGSLIFPNILENLMEAGKTTTLFSGSIFQVSTSSTFLKIPIIFPENGYTSTVIPIILAMFFISKWESFLKEKIPKSVHFTFVPFLSILVGVPVTILLFGPLANFASNIISYSILGLYNFSEVFAALVVGLAYTPLVILGLHWPLVAIGINNLATTGVDYLLPMIFTAPLAQMAVVFAVYLKTKDSRVKAIAIPAIISAFFCIIEPSIYGVTLRVKKRFFYTCIGTAIGSIIIAMNNVTNFSTTIGILGIGGFIDPKTGDASFVIVAAIASLCTLVVSFLLTYFTFSEENNFKSRNNESQNQDINSPLSGKVISLSDVKDPVFSSGQLGEGIAIEPEKGLLIAPFDCEVSMLFPTGHAIGLKSKSGIDLLIHIGINTVNYPDLFNPLVKEGDFVKQGEKLLEFDLDKLKEENIDVTTSIIVTNKKELIKNNLSEHVKYEEKLFLLKEVEDERNKQYVVSKN